MNVLAYFKYGGAIFIEVYRKDGSVFFKSNMNVKIKARPYYDTDKYGDTSQYSCSSSKYNKWVEDTEDKIIQGIFNYLKPELYGECSIKIIGLDKIDKNRKWA